MRHQKRDERLEHLIFTEDYTYDSFPSDKNGNALGKTKVTIKKSTKKWIPHGPAIYLKQLGVAKELK